jgi:hypothetical protein
MTDFENRIPEDEAMVDEWPNPEEDYMGDYDDEDDWDDYADEPEGPMDYEVKFKLKGATEEEVRTISRYLFDAIVKELEIHYSKLEDLEIEED